MDIRSLIRLLLVCAVLASVMPRPVHCEDDKARGERFDGLIEALNASSSRRAQILESIHAELRGPDSGEMQKLLRDSLSRNNTLILQGVVEAMAMFGDPRDLATLQIFLATNNKLEVKSVVIRLLPAFCLPAERARFNYIHYATGYQSSGIAAVLEPLRRPPLTRRGRLDTALERMQGGVIRSLAGQFDPVAAALPYLDDFIYGQAARRTVVHYVGDALGNDPGRWQRIWEAQGRATAVRVPDEVGEIRLEALAALADMRAEALPEVLDAFDMVFESGDDTQRQAVFETLAVMCDAAFADYPALTGIEFDVAEAVEAENWRRRRIASGGNAAVYAAARAGDVLRGDAHDGDVVFISATKALGAALGFPGDYPDADGRLASIRASGMELLERLLMYPTLDVEKRSAAVRAASASGTERAAAALRSLVHSPYATAEYGNAGSALAETVVDALRDMAVGVHPGRDAARATLLELLGDERVFPSARAGAPPVGLAHMVLWRLQRLARSNDISFRAADWRERLGW